MLRRFEKYRLSIEMRPFSDPNIVQLPTQLFIFVSKIIRIHLKRLQIEEGEEGTSKRLRIVFEDQTPQLFSVTIYS